MPLNWPSLVATVTPNLGGWAGAYFVKRNSVWYESLKKPSWTPPNWVFESIYSVFYTTTGYSSYLVWRDGGGFEGAATPLIIYAINLTLHWTWTPLFFESRKPKWALCDIVAMWAGTAVVGITFYNVNPIAGYLVIPHLAWITFNVVFNYIVYRDNKQLPVDAETAEEKKIKDVTFT